MNSMNQRLWQVRRDMLCIGLGIRFCRTADVADIAKQCGIDWLFFDFEHGAISTDAAAVMSVAATSKGLGAIVRVPQEQMGIASDLVARGATGVMVAHVDTVDEAMAAFEQVRSDGTRPFFGVMLESPLAIRNADAIAALDQVDALMIGVNDLSAELGITGSFDNPAITDAVGKVVDACTRHGKVAGMGGIFDEKLASRFIQRGIWFVLAGGDHALISAQAKQAAAGCH